MLVSKQGLDLIKKHEGLRLKAYLCPANVPTIGYGATFYEDGSKVKLGEVITMERAEKLLAFHVGQFAKEVERAIKVPIKQQQFDALVSFAYNVGIGAFRASTMLKYININPNTINIKEQFLRWDKAGGKVLPGLTKRRWDEAKLYYS